MNSIVFIFSGIFLVSQLSAQPDYTNWNSFLNKHVTADGSVHYAGVKAEQKVLYQIVAEFEKSDPNPKWSKNEQLAFWINAYNLFTVKLITDNYPLKSIQDLDKGKPWDVKRITIGGKKYSLNNIENDIIRPKFKDARIHFAVNCAAVSCPPLLNAAYLPKTLDAQLEGQTKKFFDNKKYQKIEPLKAEISKIMDWYAVDFGNIHNFINKYSTVKVNPKAKISFKEYDWALNDNKKK
ncbi:MAG: DUF547 domain-containing protein [Saprospiraceae bacterium]|nr:DUF547 domain-containing protein [Saprospiraceae bacterium]